MKLLEVLVKLFITDKGFHAAVKKGRIYQVAEYLKLGVDINSYDEGCTPLQHSLLAKKPACTVLLLENGANPNLYYRVAKNSEKTLQLPIQARAVSEIKLLALYGANLEDIYFTQDNRYLRKLVLDKLQDYQHRKNLEQNLAKATTSIDEKIAICKRLEQLWAKQCENEFNPIYLAHYQQKARECRLKTQEFPMEAKFTAADFKSNDALHFKEKKNNLQIHV